MGIYTGNGDEGFTQRIDGESVLKSDSRIEAVGAVDELNSTIGLCVCKARQAGLTGQAELLEKMQGELFVIGTHITVAGTNHALGLNDDVPEMSVTAMEEIIDAIWAELGPLGSFILPGGCEVACHLHVARTLSRRAERALSAMKQDVPEIPPIILRYLNRLSDLLFALARKANKITGLAETGWQGSGK